MWMLLEAEDVLLFRDSRPFTAGEDFRAEGLFPPLPPPVAGTIRSALLSPFLRTHGLTFRDLARHEKLQGVREALGTANSLGRLHLAGPLACTYVPGEYRPVPWFALPADLLGDLVPRLRDDLPLPGVRRPLASGLGQGHMATLAAGPAQGGVSGPNGADAQADFGEDGCEWLAAAAIQGYLCGGTRVVRSMLKVATEIRTGIQRSSANTVEAGRLYSAQMNRPEWCQENAVGLLVRVELPPGYAPLSPQYVPLGGEGRSAFLRPLDDYELALSSAENRQAIAAQILEDGGRFRLCLATAGVFAGGLIPSKFPGKLVGVASGKPLSVGAWDLAANVPRPLRRAVPPGSVYFGRMASNTREAAEALLENYHLQTTLQAQDALPEASYRAQMGFGLTLVGAWTKNEGGPGPAKHEPAGDSA